MIFVFFYIFFIFLSGAFIFEGNTKNVLDCPNDTLNYFSPIICEVTARIWYLTLTAFLSQGRWNAKKRHTATKGYGYVKMEVYRGYYSRQLENFGYA